MRSVRFLTRSKVGARRDARAVKLALARAFEAHPAGPLELKRLRVVKREQGFVFLGYRLRRRRGVTTISPAPRRAKAERMRDRFMEAVFFREFDEAERVVAQWRRGYPAWERGDRWVEAMMRQALRRAASRCVNSRLPPFLSEGRDAANIAARLLLAMKVARLPMDPGRKAGRW